LHTRLQESVRAETKKKQFVVRTRERALPLLDVLAGIVVMGTNPKPLEVIMELVETCTLFLSQLSKPSRNPLHK